MDHLVTKTHAPEDIYRASSNNGATREDKQFIHKDKELKGDIGGADSEEPKKSTLVEIPTPTSRILYKISALFPFDFFPDEIIIDEIKVSIVTKGILTRQVNSVLIKDITDILVITNPFFGGLLINGGEYRGLKITNPNQKGPLTIKFLKPEEARTARRIILGLMIFSDEKIDTSKMSVEEIIQKTQELGKAKELT